MADKKIDGVIEAVRYTPEGKILLARVYLRRGSIWSDRVMLSREELLQEVQSGKNWRIGKRVIYQGGTFETTQAVQINGSNGQEMFYTAQPNDSRDNLEGAPVF